MRSPARHSSTNLSEAPREMSSGTMAEGKITTPRSGRMGSSAGTATPLMSSSKPKKRWPTSGPRPGDSRLGSSSAMPMPPPTIIARGATGPRCRQTTTMNALLERGLECNPGVPDAQGSPRPWARAASTLRSEAASIPSGVRPEKTFHLAEVNAIVTRLHGLMERLQRGALRLHEEMSGLARETGVELATLATEELLRHRPAARALVEELDGIVAEIEASGAHLKDVQLGLVDFPAELDGEIVYLCWPLGAAAGAVALACGIVLGRRAPAGGWWTGTVLVLALGLAATLWAGRVVHPRAQRLRVALQARGEAPAADPAFRRAHRTAVALNGVALLAGLVGLGLSAAALRQ